MTRLASAFLVLTWLGIVVVPTSVYAQASITGVVKDSSGAVLPGVTVEAASPVLIEKVRAVQTDGTGQYRLVDLRPGTYTVTFTLTGFATVKREGIELTGSFTASVNADMRVGSVEETLVVTGEAPIVDVQSVQRQEVVNGDVVNAIPTNRTWGSVLALFPGITNDTGSGEIFQYGIHGGPIQEGRVQVDGINIGASRGGSGVGGYIVDIGNSAEVTFTSSGGLAEAEVGGPYMNIIPRIGGNTVKGSVFANGSTDALQNSNYTQALQNAGLRVPAAQLHVYDINGSVGGPIRKDRLWYFVNLRDIGNATSVPGMYANFNAGNPASWLYQPDVTRQARNDTTREVASLRLTTQVSPRNKLNLLWDEQPYCQGSAWAQDPSACRQPNAAPWIQGGSATAAPETAVYTNKGQRVQQASWTSPVTSRFLVEAGFGTYLVGWGGDERPGNATRGLVQVTEQCAAGCAANGNIPGLVYRSQNWAENWIGAYTWHASASYVTGAHNMKFGYQGAYYVDNEQPHTNDQNLSFRFNNGVPNQLAESAGTYNYLKRVRYNDVYAQEQWTLRRLTLQAGLRYYHAWSYSPDEQLGPSTFIPSVVPFPAQSGIIGYNDLTPRFGVVYDLFGNGKTSLKVNIGRYLDAASSTTDNYSNTLPLARVPTSVSRSWNDANHNFYPDCNLQIPTANGECGAISNVNFGKAIFSNTYDSAILGGWGVRPGDWDFGASIQHAILPRVSAEVGYYRRNFQHFTVTDNLSVAASDFTQFGVTAPVDSRLPGGGGQVISSLYDVNPVLFGQTNNLLTDSSKYGTQYQYWHGADVTVNARLGRALTVQGGTSTGRQVTDNCGIRATLPEIAPLNPYCHVALPFLTQAKGLATYIIPKVDVQLSGTWRSVPGQQLAANYAVPNAVIAPSLGRNLAGGAANATVNLIAPGALYGDRVTEIDFRVAKILKFGRTSAQVALDVYNVPNSAAVVTYNQTYSPTSTTWLTPTSVLAARWLRISAKFDF